MASDDSIASCARSCVMLFQQLHEASGRHALELDNQLSLKSIDVQSSRFDLWARNIAALHPAHLPSSLEHRIRNDHSALETVKNALRYVEESLEMALPIVSGDKENETWDMGSTSKGGQQTSELTELSLAIDDGIANLFQLSMIIRKKPEADEYLKAASQFPMPSDIDITRVGDKFPLINDGPSWLKDRLGQAITRRRQYLFARKHHQEKMQQVHEIKLGADGKTIWTGEKASTYHPKNSPEEPDPSTNNSHQFQQFGQITQYADSNIGRDGNVDLLRTPLLPRRKDGTRFMYGEHFECPYCRRMQKFDRKPSWKKHVFSDLRPYVCTFEPCGLNMFESQHQWFAHELQFHRPQYACLYCPSLPAITRPKLESHYKERHFDLTANIEDLLEISKSDRINASSCPLCQEYGVKFMKINQSHKCDVSLKQFQKHLGGHMEQLALAALPPDDTNDEEQESDEEVDFIENFSPTLKPEAKTAVDLDSNKCKKEGNNTVFEEPTPETKPEPTPEPEHGPRSMPPSDPSIIAPSLNTQRVKKPSTIEEIMRVQQLEIEKARKALADRNAKEAERAAIKAAEEKAAWERKLQEEKRIALLNYEAAQKAAADAAEAAKEKAIWERKLEEEKRIALLNYEAAQNAAADAAEAAAKKAAEEKAILEKKLDGERKVLMVISVENTKKAAEDEKRKAEEKAAEEKEKADAAAELARVKKEAAEEAKKLKEEAEKLRKEAAEEAAKLIKEAEEANERLKNDTTKALAMDFAQDE